MGDESSLPLSAVLAWWGTAWLRGRIGPDEVADAFGERYVAHVLVGGGEADAWGWLTQELRAPVGGGSARGARVANPVGIAAVFPAPGDPAGLAGPPDLTAAAVEAGQAVLTVGGPVDPGRALVPHVVGRAVEWRPHSARRRQPPDVGEADRQLRSCVLSAVDELGRLDVARWRPEVADALIDLRSGRPFDAPPGVPERCVDLARRALHLGQVADLALEDDGAAVSAGEMAARRDAVLPLARAARHALAASCSPDAWPTH